ncbi:MAG: phage repressor protein C with HTH and peptisase S24 domain [Desulforhopalus sp.]|jgi:phage repressor protein C with HTH and peptisase S24 domain
MSTFGERLQHVMRITKIKGTNLAKDLKRNKSQITRWRNSKTPPDVIVVDELAEKIKCDATWLETGKGEPFPDRYTPPAGDAINLNFGKKVPANNMVSITYIEENYASAGAGIINFDAAKEVMNFDRNFLVSQFGPTNFENVHIIHAVGDSMTRAIASGDMLFVNPGDKEVTTGAVYVFVIGEETLVKRAERNPLSGELTLRSDNTQYAPIEIKQADLDKIIVVGRVIGNLKKF